MCLSSLFSHGKNNHFTYIISLRNATYEDTGKGVTDEREKDWEGFMFHFSHSDTSDLSMKNKK